MLKSSTRNIKFQNPGGKLISDVRAGRYGMRPHPKGQ